MYHKDFHGRKVSALGLGSLRLPTAEGAPDRILREESLRVVDAAMAAGINYFDTAYTYHNGNSERFLGEALGKYPRASYHLATKFYVPATADIEAAFEEQLRRCGVDYFDVYLLHCLDEGTIDRYMDETLGYVDFLLKQKEAGRIRRIGFSSHAAPETLERFLRWFDGFDMALIQLNFVDWTFLRGKEQYEILTRRGIPVWVMEPLKGGRLVRLNEKAEAILREVAPERSVPSWAFRFLQSLPNVHTVLSGMSTPEQVGDNAEIFAAPDPLRQREMEALMKAAAVYLEDMGIPCSGCRYCCGGCPAGLDIPLLIQGWNEQRISGEVWRVPGMDQAKPATACIQCGACLKSCPQKIDIPKVMRDLSGPRSEVLW